MTADHAGRAAPRGVFGSGLGGLTVVRALRARCPREAIVYLGDTARFLGEPVEHVEQIDL
jgi:glutamate racemase